MQEERKTGSIRTLAQFLAETFVVTLIAVIIGAGIGAVTSVPVTNAQLENQVASQKTQSDRVSESFGRSRGGMSMMGGQFPGVGNIPDVENIGSRTRTNYVTEVNSAMNLTVVFQMLGIAVILTLVSGAVSILFVMRYDPLKILANRD